MKNHDITIQTPPRYLYHGTSEVAAMASISEGLKPRAGSGATGNWGHTVASNPSFVYLTDCYGPRYAHDASEDGGRGAVLEIEVERIDVHRLVPDEDYLARSDLFQRCLPDESVNGMDLYERTRWFRDRLQDYQGWWSSSVNGLGTVAYGGNILPSAISRVGLFDWRSNLLIATLAANATVSVANRRLLGGKYAALTRWFMGEDIEGREIDPVLYAEDGSWEDFGDKDFGEAMFEDSRIELEGWLERRSGLEVLNLRR